MQVAGLDHERVRLTYEAQQRAQLRHETQDDGDEILRARLRDKQRLSLRIGDEGERVVARTKAKLDFRAELEEDGDVELRLSASLRTSLRTYEAGEDRSGALASLEKMSQSIKLRLTLEASQVGDGTAFAASLDELAQSFGETLGAEADTFASAQAASPQELLEGIRAAFTVLLAGLRALFFGGSSDELPPASAATPLEPGDTEVGPPEPAAEGSAESLERATAEPETAGPSTPAPAEEAVPGQAEEPRLGRFLRLRQDLQGAFGDEFRHLLEELVRRRSAERSAEEGSTAEPATSAPVEPSLAGVLVRLDFRASYELRLIDTQV